MTFDNIEQVAQFIDKVNHGEYTMARRKWFQDVYADASSKLLVWLFNKNGELTEKIEELEKKLEPQEDSSDDVDEVVEDADVIEVSPESITVEDTFVDLDDPEEDDRH